MTDPISRAAIAFAPLGILAVDPSLTGAVVRAAPGPVRDAWLARLRALLPPDRKFRRVPASVDEGRLLGGLDLAATLAAGRPVADSGLLAEADGGVLVATGAERLSPSTAGLLALAIDQGEVRCERDGFGRTHRTRIGLVALDEGEADERLAVTLSDRLAFRIELEGLRMADVDAVPELDPAEIEDARALLPEVALADGVTEALVEAAFALGVASLRAPLLALRVARLLAALNGQRVAGETEAALAARLVLGPRATRMPEAPPAPDQAEPDQAEPDQAPEPEAQAEPETASPSPDQPPPGQPEQDQDDTPANGPSAEMILEAVVASLPPDILASLAKPNAARSDGRSAASRAKAIRGRPIGNEAGEPRAGAKLDLVATMRAAAPWQRLRGTGGKPPLAIRVSDLRIRRFQKRTGSTAIFAVDASGSAALNRLAEAKGAVEHLLSDCYVRRDQVAVIGFRASRAEVLLPPSGALARARRALRGLPGGGGTPLALGLDAAGALAAAERKRGRAPVLVVLTDGRGNIARDGTPGREAAERDALASARALRGIPSLLVDTSTRPDPRAAKLSAAMGARYLPLPPGDPARLSRAVRAAQG